MHARPPPRKVKLNQMSNCYKHDIRGHDSEPMHTYVFAYTPGIPAFVTLSGKGESHLSGFHLPASGPHSSGEVFTVLMPMLMVVLEGMKSSETVFPLTDNGVPNGSMVSLRVL